MRIFLLQNSNHNVHEGSSVIVVKNTDFGITVMV